MSMPLSCRVTRPASSAASRRSPRPKASSSVKRSSKLSISPAVPLGNDDGLFSHVGGLLEMYATRKVPELRAAQVLLRGSIIGCLRCRAQSPGNLKELLLL
jgi:hypothetical protein